MFTLLLILSSILSSCSSSSLDSDNSIDVGFNSKLIFIDNGITENQKSNIESVIKETMALVNSKMSIENITINARTSPDRVIPEIGIGGFNPNKNEVIISLNPDFEDFSNSIRFELGPLVAHELHHAKRRRSVGYGNTLLEAMISEGLADAFSVEVFDIEVPIWSRAFSESELELWIENASETWNDSGYNHSAWFFGISSDIPRWTGYSVGFKLVQDYLSVNPTRQPSDLYDEVAASFLQ